MKKILMIVILICSISLGIILIINKQENKKWDNTHRYINEIPNTGNYAVKQIVPKELLFEHGYATDKGLTEYYTDTYYKDKDGIYINNYANDREHDIAGCVFLDTLTKTVWVKTTESSTTGYHTHEELLNIDLDGTIIKRKESIDALEGLLVLKSDVTLYYDWDDNKSRFYIDHYTRQKFRWGSLNPFRGIGSPTGGGPTIYWDVIAFLNIELESSQLKFKTNTTTIDKGNYGLSTHVYRVPKKYTEGKEIVFLYVGPEYITKSDEGLYILKTNN